MNIIRPLTIAALTASLATPALADREETIYLNPFVGFQLFDDKRDLSETATFGIGAEYRFHPNWAVEAVYSNADADRKYEGGNSDFNEYRLDGIYYFAGQEEAWNPYVSAGAGHADFGDDVLIRQTAGSDHEETRVNVGAGFRYNVSDNVSIRADLREFHGIDESTFDTQATLGLSFAFSRTVTESSPKPADADNDGVPDSRDQCPGTPAGSSVDSNGCERDDDRDGVANSKDQCPNTLAGASVNSRGCELDSDNDGVVDRQDLCPGTTAGAEVDDTGCEGVTETVETIELKVQFPTNSSVIGDTYDNEIRRVAEFMREYPETTVEIAGHSDSMGEADYNRFLSQRRAEAVATRLTDALGISADRVEAVGYGEVEPIASNDTAAGRAENRRVEARIQVRR
ncbi:autotransporter outer membrane beta-barrel domain-containing protein [Marinobacter panjinensis]|uniref:Autotransporter outer membrane beta-barrel domain-containing protein n=1 Tax=Marinobacter panjinensis TaxID=2576384 RepID=A0A4U6R6V9_9GAMM|nr:OmpA family protein [Marinobacter panjinensis]MCR8914534.1 OmpA family protein [Marinobacter panjinensis]TKV68642.1 autotransporter outer membrane beta-barrel domain-containing protein [Marinobacter panjinensis]